MQPRQLGHGGHSGKQQEPRQSGCPREDTQDKGSTDCSSEEEGLVLFLPNSPERGKPWQGLCLAVPVLWGAQAHVRQPWLCHSTSDPIRLLGIPAHCPDLLAFQLAGPREPSPTTAPCDSTARTVLTQHCWSCQVLGTHLDLPFLHFLRPSAAKASSPSLRQGAALQEGGISVLCSRAMAKGKKQMQTHPLLFLQQLKSEPCPGTSPQPLIKEIPPNTCGSPGR